MKNKRITKNYWTNSVSSYFENYVVQYLKLLTKENIETVNQGKPNTI